MKFLQRLSKLDFINESIGNSKGTIEQLNFKDFEKQQKQYLKNITDGPLLFSQQRANSVIRNDLTRGKYLNQSVMYNNQASTASTGRHLNINKDFTGGLKLPTPGNAS